MKRDTLRAAVVGSGNISATYFRLAPLFRGVEIVACADLNAGLAQARAREFGIRAATVEELLADRSIHIIINLTIPAAHYAVSLAAVKAGKHVYSEKPFVLDMKQGAALARAAAQRKVTVCSAPDTFLGGAHQRARRAVDSGEVGRITSGTAAIMSHGMEHWHPNPDFFFQPGGGPMLDMGPYYITNLVQLLGPVTRVVAFATMASRTRTITSEPRRGEKIPVKTPTSYQALLEFKDGATVTLLSSWDVWSHGHGHMELYGTEGTLYLPDPNFFGGEVLATKRDGKPTPLSAWDHPLGVANVDDHGTAIANYRAVGLADMAQAILRRREPRCGLSLALHVVEIMTAVQKSGETGRFIALRTTCRKPAALPPDEARSLLKA
jgi:predicted dehydrogenase